jgi:uncharacterized protein GlcG (DUF336 family)
MDLLALAKSVASSIEAAAVSAKVPVTVCVVDVHGNVVLHHRMDGAPAFAIGISHGKAYTSALIGVRTADLVALVQPGGDLFALMAQPTYCFMGGGAPLSHDGKVIAGVGVSGGSVAQDVGILEAGLQGVAV